MRERIDENPLRAFDSKHEGTRAVMAEAPTMLERLEGDDAEHFATVRRLFEQAGIDYELDGTLVRGLDYYTRTVFEFHCGALGAQSQVAGGGRYDGLVELLGGPATPGCGWAVGVERILLALEGEQTPRPPTSSWPPPTTSGSAPWRSPPSSVTPACAPSSTSGAAG